MASYPPFDLKQASQYDLSSYFGRVKHFYKLTDPRTLLASDEQFSHAKSLLDQFRHNKIGREGRDAELWQARQLVESAFHPDTGEKVAAPFRFSAFALCNIPICALLLYPTTSNLVIGAGQFINQSFNVALNYANRNASSPMPMSTLATAYVAAVGSSCGIAFGMKALTARFQSSSASPLKIAMQRSLVPYFAVVGAGIVNLLAIRQQELTKGISVYDSEGTELGKSVVAGKDAIFKCSIIVSWTIPMVLPPLFMVKLGQIPALKRSRKLSFLTELGLIAVMITAFVPPALAAFPQYDSLPADKVEKELQLPGVEKVFFNKGL